MTNIQLLYPNDKEATACQLRDALNQEGYAVQAIEPVGSGLAPPAGDAKAVVLLWDRSSIWLPEMQAAGDAARDEGRAVDVSADGITPIGLADDARLVQFSGWSGDQHHPGWQKILAELSRISDQANGKAPPIPKSADALESRLRAAFMPMREGPSDRGPARLRLQPLMALGALVLVILFAAWAFARPARPLHPATRPAAAFVGATVRRPPVVAVNQPREPQSAKTVSSVAPAANTPIPTARVRTGHAGAATRKIHARRVEEKHVSRPAHHAREAAARPSIRYTRYSKNMRLFCQRSGRATPECRIFRHVYRSSRR